MIEKRHEAVLKPEHTRIAGFASIGSSFLARPVATRCADSKSRHARPGLPASGGLTGLLASTNR
jgi:hypothetical protein